MKILFVFMVALAGINYVSHAQNASRSQSYNDGDTTVYNTVEQCPDFPGGISKLNTYIISNLKTKGDDLKSEDSSTRFVMQMIIEKNGEVTHVKMLSKSNKKIGRKIANLLRRSPKWKPGLMNGKPVRTYYTIPISCLLWQTD